MRQRAVYWSFALPAEPSFGDSLSALLLLLHPFGNMVGISMMDPHVSAVMMTVMMMVTTTAAISATGGLLHFLLLLDA